MNSLKIITNARAWPIFSVQDCAKWFPDTRRSAILLGLNRYTASGLLIRLRRGLYLINQEPYPDSSVLASRLDTSAIVSLETVLHRSGMIPEVPFATTLVTPAMTAQYHPAVGGAFHFRHMKKELFFGFSIEHHSPYAVRVATPEKALLDLLWFHRFQRDRQAYIEGLRLDIPSTFSWKNFRLYAKLFNNRHLSELSKVVAHNFCNG